MSRTPMKWFYVTGNLHVGEPERSIDIIVERGGNTNIARRFQGGEPPQGHGRGYLYWPDFAHCENEIGPQRHLPVSSPPVPDRLHAART